MPQYDFKDQEQLLEIAIQICEDYNASEFTFGGGTMLSAGYYNHRMSFDIDIFSEDFSFISNLIENKNLICDSLGISYNNIEASPSAITFILSSENAGLKLDFIYSESLTKNPYEQMNILNQSNVKVQTAQEIIARKLKYREILTVRDFVDFSYVQENSNMIKKLQLEYIEGVDLERYIDLVDQFTSLDQGIINDALKYLDISSVQSYQNIKDNIKSIIELGDKINIIYDDDFEIVSLDSFNDKYIEFANEVGTQYFELEIDKKELELIIKKDVDYKTILGLSKSNLCKFFSLQKVV